MSVFYNMMVIQETVELIAAMWAPIQAVLAGVSEIHFHDGSAFQTFKIIWRIAADYKAAVTIYGLKGQNSTFTCMWCFCIIA